METGRISEGSGGSPGFSSSGFDKGGIRAGSNWESYSVSGLESPPPGGPGRGFFCSFFHGLTGAHQPIGKGLWDRNFVVAGRPLLAHRRRPVQGPKTTLCMIRPGRNVKAPATISAPKKIDVIVILWRRTLCRRA